MSLVAVALAAGLVAALILGGRVRYLGAVRLRSVGLLLGGGACELAGSHWGDGAAGTAILVAGYLLLIGFALRNAALTGMVLVAFGLCANATVITLDGGMPVRGLPAGINAGARHHGERPGDHLTALADVVHLAPLHETVSPGDLVLSLGVATLVVAVMRPRRPVARSGAPTAAR
jgi:hypothetical protein